MSGSDGAGMICSCAPVSVIAQVDGGSIESRLSELEERRFNLKEEQGGKMMMRITLLLE